MARKFFRRWMPAAHAIRDNRVLAWFGPAIHHPQLWHVNRRGIALGVAIGGFFGLLVPIGQIPIAAAAAILLRANLAAAVASTFVTNPFTFAPIYYLAYRTGMRLTGAERRPLEVDPLSIAEPHGIADRVTVWFEQMHGVGKPLFIGLFVMACIFALVGYFCVDGLWRAIAIRSWKRRGALRTGATDHADTG